MDISNNRNNYNNYNNIVSYKTVKKECSVEFTEKKSVFICSIKSVADEQSALDFISKIKSDYNDASHNVYAYIIRNTNAVRFSDDGEPSSTAGKPILGQINSNELTDILVVVIRYFGGIELGTSGLTVAYRTAAAEAIAAAGIEERTVDEEIKITFEYPYLNGVMRIVKEMRPEIVSQTFEMTCEMTLRIRKSESGTLKNRLSKVESVSFN